MDFFQRSPPFLIQLQNILRKYPDGGQILKEIIQNADDAQASEVLFIYDEREYGTETLDSKELHSIQGPALLVYNNQTFSDNDWKGIQEPGNSIKRKDPNTVGRFGLGFNSVYHITDYPAIFSGKNIGILDPQETIFHRGGCWWNLEKHKQHLEELEDQFHPFQKVLEDICLDSWNNILNTGYFKGTLFRFPLRLKRSDISDNLYNSERVQELFDSFIRDADISLLFLRHVKTISMKRIGSDGNVNHLLTVSVSSEELKTVVSPEMSTGTHFKVTCLKGYDREEECKWLVITSSVNGNLFPDLLELSKKLCNKPSLDLAYPLSKDGIASFGGRLSCFLPLPDKEENRTGLPLLINGSFDLTDDRRSMKWLEIDQQHDEAAQWNHILVEQLLPLVYTHAIKDAVSLVKTSKITAEVAYGIWPDPDRIIHKSRWHNLIKKMAHCLLNERVLQTADKCHWIAAHEAFFFPLTDDEEDDDNPQILNCLEQMLLLLKQPLVKIPGNVHKTIMAAENSPVKLNTVCPTLVRKVLHNGDWRTFPNEKKVLLLTYVVSDQQYSDLLNLQLLPLSDGTFTSFQKTDINGVVYIDSPTFPRILLPELEKRFLPKDIPSDLLLHLKHIVTKRIFNNLVNLDKDVIMKKIHEGLPKTWQGSHNPVNWHPKDPNNPPIEWLSTFWHFLQRHEDILDSFENQPLVPLVYITEVSTEIPLARLTKKTALLFRSLNEHSMTDVLSEVLEQVGCTVIQNKNSWLWHKHLNKYILEPNPNNVLKVFSYCNLESIVQKCNNMSKEHIKILCKFISQAFSIKTQELEILHRLPIFCKVKSIGSSDSRLVAALHRKAVERKTLISIPEDLVFPDVLLQCRNESDQRLLQLMKITLLNPIDVALLLGRAIQEGSYYYYPQEVQQVMLWILRNGHTLLTQSGDLKKICESINFIPCNDELVQPSVLYDPDISIFKELFDGEKFPPVMYNEPSVLISLRTLGLKNSIHSIRTDDVLQIATKISNEADEIVSLKKAKALIKVCNNTNVLSQLNSRDLKKLCSLTWVPVDNIHAVFSEPEKLRSKKYSRIVEYSMTITNEFNDFASAVLGLNEPPPAFKVLENLNIFSQQYQKEDPCNLVIKLHTIYEYIQSYIGQFHELLQNVLIWNGEGFSSPSDIVLLYPEDLDLSCTVKRVPHEFLIYRDLFSKCGVRNTLSENEVTQILYTLKNEMDTLTPIPSTCKEIHMSISILDWMRKNGVNGRDDLPIPVEATNRGFSLEPLSTALFCDMDKQYLKDISDNCKDYYIVHEEVSPATAKFLNIQLLSTNVLKPEFFEPWGPSEPVTLRIKNILREYSEHVEIFKELLQNADDADATVCDFLVDMRQNFESRHSLIDADMASCHGAALWSYNNSKFTDEDFRNIIRIGAATKETQKQKIGKFGLGFNTVYHITDVPSIMSGSQVLIFDPNVNHIKKHIPNTTNPGIKLDLQKNSKALNIFPDQFQPFSGVFGCELNLPFYFNGTLIRLPFRTEQEAKDSQIFNQAFTEEKIESLIAGFEESNDILLIFLKKVQNVTLDFLTKDFNVRDKVTKVKLQRYQVQCLKVPEDIILQQEQIISSEKLGIDTNDFTVTKIIKISVEKMMTSDEKHYMIQYSLGINKSFQMFIQKKEIYFPNPVAGVALPLKKDLFTGKWVPNLQNFEGIVFCFLPLPVLSGLPFHINGSFSVMSNRKSLWDTTEKGEWNIKLLCDAVIIALITALSQVQILSQKGDIQDYCYHTFWPDIKKVKTQFREAVKVFYQALTFGFANCFPALFSNGQEYCTVKHACFLELDNIQNEKLYSLAQKVFSLILKKPYLAISLPDWVKHSFIESNCYNQLLLNTYNLERFYREIIFENLELLETEDRNALILYALDLNNKELNKLLKSKPCIPSSLQGKLQFIEKLVHPAGKVSILYAQEEGFFPHGADFLATDRLTYLQHLGMKKDKLPMKSLMERACKISNIWKHNRKKGLLQICCILELLNDLLDQCSDNTWQEAFRDIVFLPAVPPLKNFGAIEDLILMKSSDLYHYKYKDLVCMTKPVLSKQHVGTNVKFSDKTLTFLGLDQSPTSEIVLLQLQQAHKIPNILIQELSQIVKKCYGFLDKLIKKQPHQIANLKKQTSSVPFIYIEQEFVPIKFVAYEISFNASPYLYKLPQEYVEFHELWACTGLCKEFSIDNYVSVLERMARKHNGRCLPENERRVAIQVLETISNKDSINLFGQRILVPDQQGILRHVDKIYFNDTPWIPCDKEQHFCHDRISRSVALQLGIKTKIHQTLQKLKISDLSHWVSNFGAREYLTTRLKNIINEYSSKKDIVKELIQNADDSEATEVHFVLDTRTHPTECTFGPEWHPLQCPALCVYNNKKFESRDIDGIQNLGTGGKADRLDKTGKFGLGFNSVYHITDCPSFVSGDDILCVFDPNCNFLETSEHSSPGGMFKVNNKFKDTFKDVYHTFLPSLFNLQEGTLFRLPLRTAETVAKSKISDQTVKVEDILNICLDLENDGANMMLFLNYINKITFSEVSDTGGLKELLSIKIQTQENSRQAFQEKISCLDGNEQISEIVPFRIFYKMALKISSSDKTMQWLIGKQIGIEGENNQADLNRISANLHQTLIPHGAVAACLNDEPKGRAFCTLPLPIETNLPVHINGNFLVDTARRDLCKEDGGSSKTEWNTFLLSNVIAPLYCSVLGQIQNISMPNEAPLEFKKLESCKVFLSKMFLRFLPRVTNCVSPQWKEMVVKVYQTIFEKRLKLIPIYKEIAGKYGNTEIVQANWSVVGQDSVTEEPYFFLDDDKDKNKSIRFLLHKINMKLAFSGSSNFIYEEFKAAGKNVLELNPKTLSTFLTKVQLHPQGYNLPRPVCETLLRTPENCNLLLQYCMQDRATKNGSHLQGLPLLVTADGMVQNINKDEPRYYTEFYGLFPDDSNLFANYKLCSYLELTRFGYLKNLTVQNAADYIKKQLGPAYQTPSRTLPKEKKAWLQQLWSFFESEINSKQIQNQCMQTFKEIITIFHDWSIVPVCYEKPSREITLLPLASMKKIIQNDSNPVSKCLLQMGFPKLETLLLSTHMKIYYIYQFLLDTENCYLVLEQLYSTSGLHWEVLDKYQMNTILQFFLDNLKKKNLKKDHLHKLQSLPIFETQLEKRKSLNAFPTKYILDFALPSHFKKFYELDSQVIFLKNNHLNQELCEYINIQVINIVQFLNYLIPHIKSFCQNDIVEILHLLLKLKTDYVHNDKTEGIITALKPLKFIEDKQGIKQQPSYFYDHTVALFSMFNLQSSFIPEAFIKKFANQKTNFHEIMLDLGMQNKLSEDDCVKFARMIETESKSHCSFKQLGKKSKMLFATFLTMDTSKFTSRFIQTISDIKFLLPLDVNSSLKRLHPSYTESKITIALRGSLLKQQEQDELLVWTSMPLLEKGSTLCEKKMIFLQTKCGVFCTPPCNLVVENIKNVCNAPCESKELLHIRTLVLKRLYVFLQDQENLDVNSLTDVPFILVHGDALAKPRQVVFNLCHPEPLHPYLYKLLPHLACFSQLFQSIGVEDEASIAHYGQVLSTIYEDTVGRTHLHPNLIKTAYEAINRLYCLLKDKPPKDITGLKSLYLLATDGKLYDSSSLVLNNCRSILVTTKLSDIFTFLSLPVSDQYDQEHFIKCLPTDIRPKLLSQITTETIHVKSENTCTYGANCEFKCHLEKLLISPIFIKALACLLRSQSKGTMSNEEASQICSVVFGKLEIKCFLNLQTVLTYEDKPLKSTNLSKPVFVRRGKEGQCQIYFKHNDTVGRHAVKISKTLAREINNIMENVYSYSSVDIIQEILCCANPDEIINVLEENEIYNELNKKDHHISLPNPGEPIPTEWYDALDMSLLHCFRVGEYVGYMDPSKEECYLYAIIVEELDFNKIQMYRINLGHNNLIDVSILDLYQFKRISSQKSTALVLVENPMQQEEMQEIWYEKSIEDTKKEIDQYLTMIWKLPNEERAKAIRRLYLKYHPDKNIGQEKLSTEICKYLQQRIRTLEAGNNTKSQASSSGHYNPSWNFSNFWGRWDKEASHHRQYHENFSRKTKCDYNFYGYHSRPTKPKPEEAERWFRQAECDLRAAENDVDHNHTEWVFYKVHQAVEKALFASQYIKNGQIDKNESLGNLAGKVSTYCSSLYSISKQVLQLEMYGVDKLKTQYPNFHTPPGIPNDSMPSSKEHEVIALAKDVLQKIKSYVY